MADADLDMVIRQLAKKQNRDLIAAVKNRRDRFIGLAAKAKDKAARDTYREIAKSIMLQGVAAARRLQMSADNVADSYARSMRQAAEARANANTAPITKKAAKKTGSQTTAPAGRVRKPG